MFDFNIAAAKLTWHSEAYSHYDVHLQQEKNVDGSPRSLTYVFTCQSRPDDHPPVLRPRAKTAEGTSNLVRTMNICLDAQGLTRGSRKVVTDAIPYSPAAHRALIALRCAKNSRPFNTVTDEEYQLEVSLLRPNTTIPSPITVSRDINTIYLQMSRHVQQYFKVSFRLTGLNLV